VDPTPLPCPEPLTPTIGPFPTVLRFRSIPGTNKDGFVFAILGPVLALPGFRRRSRTPGRGRADQFRA